MLILAGFIIVIIFLSNLIKSYEQKYWWVLIKLTDTAWIQVTPSSI